MSKNGVYQRYHLPLVPLVPYKILNEHNDLIMMKLMSIWGAFSSQTRKFLGVTSMFDQMSGGLFEY